jgi:hypothetical protein
LRDDIFIYPTPYFENTARVIPPGKAFPEGRIVVNAGQPRELAGILHRFLLDPQGRIDFTRKADVASFATGPTKAQATDNQIVRLKDGSLLAFRDSYLWDEIKPKPPPWIKEIVSGSGDHSGQRSGELVFRSVDGGATWTLISVIDFGVYLGGKYGVPRPMDDKGNADVPLARQGRFPDGHLKWWVGGLDRTEVYACPFSGCVYLTTRAGGGPYKNLFPKTDTMLLLYSKDNGKTWQAISENLPNSAPLVMTSTPNGRLFLLQILGDQPTVYWTLSPVQSLHRPAVPQLSPGYPVHYLENGKSIPCKGPAKPVDLLLQCAHPSLSRVSTDTQSSRIRVAYQAVNAKGAQEARVVLVDVRDPARAPLVTSLNAVRAESPADHSCLFFTFIDPDYIDMPGAVKSNVSVLYWLEAPRVGVTPKRFSARYCVFHGAGKGSEPAFLSVQNGHPRTWSVRQDPGDYMSGGFFWWNGNLNYLTQWVEPDGIKANIVTISDRSADSPSAYRKAE